MTRTHRALGLAAGALLLLAGPASAATHNLAVGDGTNEATWKSGTHSGFVYTSSVSKQVPACTSAVFECETVLVEVKEAGKAKFAITGTSAVPDATVPYDVDLHVYRSDAKGTMGTMLGEGTSPAADEAVTVAKAAPGFYLLVTDWYFGAGTIDGKVTFTPTPKPAA